MLTEILFYGITRKFSFVMYFSVFARCVVYKTVKYGPKYNKAKIYLHIFIFSRRFKLIGVKTQFYGTTKALRWFYLKEEHLLLKIIR